MNSRINFNFMLKIITLILLFFTFRIGVQAQVAAPVLIRLGTQDNPATIYWKNKHFFVGYVNIEQNINIENLKDSTKNYSQKFKMNEISIGAKADGIAFEIAQKESKQSQEQPINFKINGKTNILRMPLDGTQSETNYQGALGSDVVSFGYTSVAKGSEEMKTKGDWLLEDVVCCYNNQYVDLEWSMEQTSTSVTSNNTYGFSFKMDDIYLGYAIKIQSEEGKIYTQKTKYRYLVNGSIVPGTTVLNDTSTYKYEDIVKRKYYYGIAYYYDNDGGDALHIEANRVVRPEKYVKKRNDDYSSSTSEPYYSEKYMIEYRYVNGFFLNLLDYTENMQKASWQSDSEFSEQKINQQQIILGYSGESYQLLVAGTKISEKSKNTNSKGIMKGIGISYIF